MRVWAGCDSPADHRPRQLRRQDRRVETVVDDGTFADGRRHHHGPCLKRLDVVGDQFVLVPVEIEKAATRMMGGERIDRQDAAGKRRHPPPAPPPDLAAGEGGAFVGSGLALDASSRGLGRFELIAVDYGWGCGSPEWRKYIHVSSR